MASDARAIHRRHLYARGGSYSINLPTGWVKRNGIEGEVEVVETPDGLLIRKTVEELPGIEHEPEFRAFLDYLLRDSLRHPEALVDPEPLLDDIDRLIEGVEPE
jgi:hypothetical protein